MKIDDDINEVSGHDGEKKEGGRRGVEEKIEKVR